MRDLCLGHRGAPLVEPGLDWAQSSLDLRQLGSQTVDGAAALHRRGHLRGEWKVTDRRGHTCWTCWSHNRHTGPGLADTPSAPAAAATAWPPAAERPSLPAPPCRSTSSSAAPWCTGAGPSGGTAGCGPPATTTRIKVWEPEDTSVSAFCYSEGPKPSGKQTNLQVAALKDILIHRCYFSKQTPPTSSWQSAPLLGHVFCEAPMKIGAGLSRVWQRLKWRTQRHIVAALHLLISTPHWARLCLRNKRRKTRRRAEDEFLQPGFQGRWNWGQLRTKGGMLTL